MRIAHLKKLTLASMVILASLQGPALADSIWNDTSTATLFTDRRPTFVIGGLITINVNERLSAINRAQSLGQKQLNQDHKWSFPQEFATGGKALQGQFKAQNQLQNNMQGSTNRNSVITFDITARIDDILPNGNLVVSANKTVRVNDEEMEMVLSGVVRQNDVAANNRVSSALMSDTRIEVKGTGPVSAKNTGGVLSRIFNFLL